VAAAAGRSPTRAAGPVARAIRVLVLVELWQCDQLVVGVGKAENLGFRKAEADTVGTTDPAEFGNVAGKVNVAEAGAAVSWPERARTDFEDPIVLQCIIRRTCSFGVSFAMPACDRHFWRAGSLLSRCFFWGGSPFLRA
jgi:hypothetical protein